MLREGSQKEGGFKGKLVQRNSNVLVLLQMLKMKEEKRSGL